MGFLRTIFTSLRAITHDDAQTSSGAGVSSQSLAPLDEEIYRVFYARYRAEEAQAQFNEEDG